MKITPELPEKKVNKTIEKTVEEAKELEFSKSQADKQTDLYNKLLEEKEKSEEAFTKSISTGSDECSLEELKSKQEIADNAFESFVTSEELVDELKEDPRGSKTSQKLV